MQWYKIENIPFKHRNKATELAVTTAISTKLERQLKVTKFPMENMRLPYSQTA